MPEEELWQGYSLNGEPSRPITKTQARKGELHGASHVWVWHRSTSNSQIEVLLQKRAKDKLTWPGFLDISAAGHIDGGETPLVAAKREASEEIDLHIDTNKLQLLFVRYVDDTVNGVREKEFVWVYLYELPSLVDDFRLKDGEVDAVQWVTLDVLEKLTHDGVPEQQIVPRIYLADLLGELRRLL